MKTAKKAVVAKPDAKPEPKPEPKAAKPEPKVRVRKYDPAFTIKVLKTDQKPKKNGRNPYAIYADGKTLGQCLKEGCKPADFWWDSRNGVIEIVRPS